MARNQDRRWMLRIANTESGRPLMLDETYGAFHTVAVAEIAADAVRHYVHALIGSHIRVHVEEIDFSEGYDHHLDPKHPDYDWQENPAGA